MTIKKDIKRPKSLDTIRHHNIRTNIPGAKWNPDRCRYARKFSYLTEDDAIMAMHAMWVKNPDEELGSFHHWQCIRCKKWHIGHR